MYQPLHHIWVMGKRGESFGIHLLFLYLCNALRRTKVGQEGNLVKVLAAYFLFIVPLYQACHIRQGST